MAEIQFQRCAVFRILVEKKNKATLFKVTEPNSVPYRAPPACAKVCVECLIGKQNKPTLFKVIEPSSVAYSVCVLSV